MGQVPLIGTGTGICARVLGIAKAVKPIIELVTMTIYCTSAKK
jgi:hypothetical protein